jgi:hypothetical protein
MVYRFAVSPFFPISVRGVVSHIHSNVIVNQAEPKHLSGSRPLRYQFGHPLIQRQARSLCGHRSCMVSAGIKPQNELPRMPFERLDALFCTQLQKSFERRFALLLQTGMMPTGNLTTGHGSAVGWMKKPSVISLALSQGQPLGHGRFSDKICATTGVRRSQRRPGRPVGKLSQRGEMDTQTGFGF